MAARLHVIKGKDGLDYPETARVQYPRRMKYKVVIVASSDF